MLSAKTIVFFCNFLLNEVKIKDFIVIVLTFVYSEKVTWKYDSCVDGGHLFVTSNVIFLKIK